MDPHNIDIALTNVGAVIRLDGGRFLFQLRDDIPNIVMPGRWGFFGGHVEPGEDCDTAIVREIGEETSFTPRSISLLTELVYPRIDAAGRPIWVLRKFYDVPVTDADVAAMRLGEGAAMRVMTGVEYLALPNIICWEAAALVFVMSGGSASEQNMGRGLL